MNDNRIESDGRPLPTKTPHSSNAFSQTSVEEEKVAILTHLLQVNRKAYDLPAMGDEQLKLYIADLWRYSPDDVAAALGQCRRTVKYGFPKIADIVQAIEGSVEEQNRPDAMTCTARYKID